MAAGFFVIPVEIRPGARPSAFAKRPVWQEFSLEPVPKLVFSAELMGEAFVNAGLAAVVFGVGLKVMEAGVLGWTNRCLLKTCVGFRRPQGARVLIRFHGN